MAMVEPLVMGAGHKAAEFPGQAKIRPKRRKALARADARPAFRLCDIRGPRFRTGIEFKKLQWNFAFMAGFPNDGLKTRPFRFHGSAADAVYPSPRRIR
jgi:hypothetical protein